MAPIKVLVTDDDELMRDGLRCLLEDDMEVYATSDGVSAVTLSNDVRPDVTVMDLSMPGLPGLEATRLIVNANAKAKVIVLSGHSDERMIAAAFDAGASGFVFKHRVHDELLPAIRAVLAGETYVSAAFDGGPGVRP